MEKNIKVLTDILQKETPVLFLGAGFSYGCKNVRGTLPTGAELAAEIYEKFLEENCEPEDRDEVKKFNLRQMCQAVSASDRGQKQMKEFLFERFSQVSPQSFHYHLLKYPWKRIYTVNIDDVVENIYKPELFTA